MKHIGETLKAIIEANNLQKNKVANLAGISPTYLSRIFDKRTIDCDLLDKLSKAIGVRASLFFEDSPASSCSITDVNATALVGSATVNISQGEADALRRLIDEKERTIQILMRAKGFDELQDL